MQRPPKGLPLVPATPLHDAMNRINSRAAELANLRLGTNEQTSIRLFVERAFTQSVLGLSGTDASIAQITGIQEATELENPYGPDSKIRRTLASIKVLEEAAEHDTALTPELVLKIHNPFLDEVSRTQLDAEVNKTAAAMVRVGAFCQWAAADSFKELNTLEQAAIVVLRLLEIRPFEEGNIGAALGAGSLFTMLAGWPPIIIPASLRNRFNPAVGEGLKMNTRPLIDLFAEAILETVESLIKFVKALNN